MASSSGVHASHAGYIVFDCPDCGVKAQEAEVHEDREAGEWWFSCTTDGCPFEDHNDIRDALERGDDDS